MNDDERRQGGEPVKLSSSRISAGIDRRPQMRSFTLRGLSVAGAGMLLSAASVALLPAQAMLAGAGAGVVGLLYFVALLMANARSGPKLTVGRLEIDGRRLRLPDHGKNIDLRDVMQGWREDPDLVHLSLKSGEVIVLKLEGAYAVEPLLRAAGVTAAQRVLRIPLVSAASRIPGGSVVGGILLAIFGSGLLAATLLLTFTLEKLIGSGQGSLAAGLPSMLTFAGLVGFAAYALLAALQRREVTVGTDGIAFRSTFRTEFIPYGSLAAVEHDTRGVRLVRKDGRRLLLPTRGAGDRPLPLARQGTPTRTPAEAQRRVLVERIEAAMAAGGGAGMAHVAMDRLDRQGRSREAWREDLGKMLGADGDYRSALVSPEDLGGLIEDPSAPAERRIAAAVALSAREGEEARRRVRIAVQACADEDLRGALEAAAEGEIEEAALGRAMARRA